MMTTRPEEGAACPASGARPAFKCFLAEALLVFVLACLVGAGWLVYRNMTVETRAERWEAHTRVVIQSLGDLLSSLKDAETGQRGFLITGQPEYLAPYQASLKVLPVQLDNLRQLTADNPRQQQRLAAITTRVEDKLAVLKESIALRRAQGFPAAREALVTDPGKDLMDQLRVLVAGAQQEEALLLKDRVAKQLLDSHRTAQSVLLVNALGVVTLLLLLVCIRRELVSRRMAEAAQQASQARYQQLFNSMDEGFCSIELLFDADNKPIDFRYLKVNAAFEAQTGLPNATGKRVRELIPDLDASWFEVYGAVALTGESTRFVNEVKALDSRWFDVYAFRIDEPQMFRVAVLFRDVTERKLAETALRQSEAFSRSILKSSSDCIKVLDLDGNLLSMHSGQDLLGIDDLQPFLNQPWVNFWTGEDRRAAQAAVNAAASGGAGAFVGFFRTPRGEAKWWDVIISPILDASDRPVRLLAVSRDVTRRQLAEEALRQSEERWRFALQVAELGAWELNLADRTAWRSELHDQIFGYPAQLPCWSYEDFLGHVVEADRAGVTQSFEQSMTQLESHDRTSECRIRRTDGAVRWIWVHIKTVRSVEGGAGRMFGLVKDITDRKAAEQRLIDSEERLRLAAEAAHFGMYDRDLGGAHFHISPQIKQILGYAPDVPLDHLQVILHMHPDDQPMGVAAFQRACDPAGDGRLQVEQRIVRCDGTVRWIASVGRVLFDEAGVPRRSLGFWVDITERRRLELQTQEQAQVLAELARRKDEFLAMLSHELRNPLAALSNAFDLLRLQESDGVRPHQTHRIIDRQMRQLKHLVDDLLDVTRITSGSVRLRRAQVSVSDVVARAVETAQPLITQRQHSFKVSLPLQPLWLDADAARLEQVLVNLLTNAAKYTDEGGHIALSVERQGDAAVLRVRDNGIGIEPELLPRIFGLFTQAERAIDRSQGGLGIGLCLAQRLVELHGGTLEVHSVFGQGSEFVVRLPVMLAALPPQPQPLINAALVPGKGCRVLIVDDNVDAVKGLAALLKMSGHTVAVAYDGPSALPAALATPPDVVLLDIGLPGLTGYEVAQQMRREPTLRNIVLVALTGYGRETDRQLSQEAGFDYHLVKPADFNEIERIVASVAERVA